ncbi:MAG: glycosyltransferase family 4 protein [Candidatus Heimdallarchaeum endolithica]|uniref:Glycosyltransferase family 4 protein n=1 Tax=Candidatus Heimdallarchaeum endolithica TaxID=2876572 RepID=A0A9Y1BTS9_9ARCH|nr:MAG: glycosyltransferase family 4 protein [Candidatus Heimdallarchaeum endolithica]
MKLLFVLPKSIESLGGIETTVRNIVKKLEIKGYKIDILCTEWKQKGVKIDNYSQNIRLIKVNRIIFKNKIYLSPQIIKYFNNIKYEYDQIHIHSLHSLTSLCLLYSIKEKTVFTPHFHPSSGSGTVVMKLLLNLYLKIFGKKVLRNVSKLIAVSNYEKDLIVKLFEFNKDNIVVIPHGISERIKTTNQFTTPPKNVLYIGRFIKQKGVMHILNVFVELKKQFEDLNLTLIGGGPLINKIKKFIKRNNITDSVNIFENVQSNFIYESYKKSDLFLMLSKYEAFGIAIAEAIASGVPTIVKRSGGIATYLINGTNGFFIDNEKDIRHIVEVATKILSNNELRNKLRNNGIKLKNKLSWEKSAIKTVSLITSNYLE